MSSRDKVTKQTSSTKQTSASSSSKSSSSSSKQLLPKSSVAQQDAQPKRAMSSSSSSSSSANSTTTSTNTNSSSSSKSANKRATTTSKSNDNNKGSKRATNSRSNTVPSQSQSAVSFRGKKLSITNELIEIEDKNLNEMATTKFPDESQMIFSSNSISSIVVEQETDVDGGVNLLDNSSPTIVSPTNNNNNNKTTDKQQVETVNKQPSSSSAAANEDEDINNKFLPRGWEQHSDKEGLYYWHVSTGVIQRNRPTSELSPRKDSLVFYHDDEEINQVQTKTSSDDDDYYESGAALTADDTSESTFVVYPLGRCEFDETQLVSAASTKTIQKCILRLCNQPSNEDTVFWGLDQSTPVLMRLFEDCIQFTDIKTRTLLRNQTIQSIKTWAVDDDNNFAFVIEENATHQHQHQHHHNHSSSFDDHDDERLISTDAAGAGALLNEPVLMCYVFSSMDDDDMSCKVAAKLNEEITRFREQQANRMSKSTRIQQMIEHRNQSSTMDQVGATQMSDTDDFDDLEASSELTMNVKYIGKTSVVRPTGIGILNAAIDRCLDEINGRAPIGPLKPPPSELEEVSVVDDEKDANSGGSSSSSKLIEAKIHVSPSSVIVENVLTGEIIVECRIRYLTFIGISIRDTRWCGFIMQSATNNKSFIAHTFECNPTAGHVCEAIQTSCKRMYEKVVKNSSSRQPETMSIIPTTTSSKIRNTLAKTFSRIRLNPIS